MSLQFEALAEIDTYITTLRGFITQLEDAKTFVSTEPDAASRMIERVLTELKEWVQQSQDAQPVQ